MKKTIFLFILIFSINLHSECLLENFKHNFSFKLNIADINQNDLIIKYKNDNLYIFVKPIEQDKEGNYFNYLIKYNNTKKESIVLKIENKGKYQAYNIDINEKYFALLCWKRVLIYKWENNNYHYNDEFKYDGSFDNIVLDKNFIFLYDCCIASSTMDEDTQTHLIKYDLEKEKIVFDEWLPNPDGFQFTFFGPRNLIEANEKFTLVADANNYKIKVYNPKNDAIDEITRNDVDWKTHPTTDSILKTIYITSNRPKESIDNLRPLTGLISLTHRMSFINDSTFVLLWSKPWETPFYYFFYFDIWGFRDGKWKLLKKDLRQVLDENALFNFDKMEITNSYTISNSKLILVTDYPFDLEEEKYKFMTFAELKKQTNEYYKKNDLSFTIIVYEYVEK